ncbi:MULTISPECIES: S9 family peptidase [Acidithrix]|uniref:Protease 2 n=1 Tax=Acidithrix ferrooxidans TaxID=1280514 RepID=A0A0D8HJA1_9ACTN|nr:MULTISPECIES: S9 family peptidase [Acidithrix]KJF17842.1 protease 2 [Acidithrix ferrooxidans]
MSAVSKIFKSLTPPKLPPKNPSILLGLGEPRIDNYFWMNESENPSVRTFIDEENAFARTVLSNLEPLREKVYSEFLERIELEDHGVPQRRKHFWYYGATDKESQYEIHFRYKDRGYGEPTIVEQDVEVVLNENELAQGHEFFSLGSTALSDDENLIAYGIDTTGAENYEIYIKDLSTGKTIHIPTQNATYGLEFDIQAKRLFWVESDDATRPYKVNVIDLNNIEQGSMELYKDDDQSFGVSIGRSKDNKTLIVDSSSTTSSEAYFLDLSDPQAQLELFQRRTNGLEYSVEPIGDQIYILSNLKNDNFHISICPRGQMSLENWSDLLPIEPNIKIEAIEIFDHHLAIEERRDGFARIRIVDLLDQSSFEIPVQDEASTLELSANPEMDANSLRYSYTSMTTPRSTFEIDLKSKEIKLLKQTKVLGGFDPSDYSSAVIRIRARDGVEVGVSLIYPRDISQDGNNPVVLYGYGSYEHSIDPRFSTLRLSLCSRGAIFAIAHIRGGGELGRQWYLDGKLVKKHNTFNDFVDVARGLVDLGWTQPGKIMIMGGSAGGMLVGAALNQDPSLFGGVIAEVPFVDCLTTISNPSLPLTIPEWEEWGNPLDDYTIYKEMLSYSPYDNVAAGVEYPPLLVTSGLTDPRVSYVEPSKWVAKIREITTNPKVILWTETSAGHFGTSGRFNEWEMESRIYAFVLGCLFDDIEELNNKVN